jgi:hypothetical protein
VFLVPAPHQFVGSPADLIAVEDRAAEDTGDVQGVAESGVEAIVVK